MNCLEYLVYITLQAGAIEECIFFPICFVFAKSDSLEQEREKVIKEHSVLEQIWIKGSYIPRTKTIIAWKLILHRSKIRRIEIPCGGSHYIELAKTDFFTNTKKAL